MQSAAASGWLRSVVGARGERGAGRRHLEDLGSALAPIDHAGLPHRPGRHLHVATEIWEVRADTASVAHTIAQQSFSYIADLDDVELVDAYTRKATASASRSPADAVLPEAVTTTASAPQFSALASRTIVFPSVAAGDTVHYELRRRARETLFPGQFTLTVEPGALDHARACRHQPRGCPRGWTLRVERRRPRRSEPGASCRTAARSGAGTGPRLPAGAVALRRLQLPRLRGAGTRLRRPGVAAVAARRTPCRQLADRLAQGADGPARGRRPALPLRRHRDPLRRHLPRQPPGRAAGCRRRCCAEGWGDCKDHAALLQAHAGGRGHRGPAGPDQPARPLQPAGSARPRPRSITSSPTSPRSTCISTAPRRTRPSACC